MKYKKCLFTGIELPQIKKQRTMKSRGETLEKRAVSDGAAFDSVQFSEQENTCGEISNTKCNFSAGFKRTSGVKDISESGDAKRSKKGTKVNKKELKQQNPNNDDNMQHKMLLVKVVKHEENNMMNYQERVSR